MLKGVEGVQDCVVDFDQSTATCKVSNDVEPKTLLSALKSPYTGTLLDAK